MADPLKQTKLSTAMQRMLDGPTAAPAQLPRLFRLTSIERLPVAHGCQHRATLFHEQAALTVRWTTRHPDVTLSRGCLVDIRWTGVPICGDGAIRVARLVRLDRPLEVANLFDTIPTAWVRDRELVHRAKEMWEGLPRGFQHLFNAVFWDSKRFQRYLVVPSSLAGHHRETNGNFRHCVEVADQALVAGACYGTCFPPILILGGLLHDAGKAGKADEYDFDPVSHQFRLSERGELVGHKQTVIEWLAAARAQHRVILPDAHYLALIHALTAAKGAPDWLGLRQPRTLDATILSVADRLSGEGDLHRQMAPEGTGFGRYHRHLRGRPYVTGP